MKELINLSLGLDLLRVLDKSQVSLYDLSVLFTFVPIPDVYFSLLCVLIFILFFFNVPLMLYGNLELLYKPLVEMASSLFSLTLLSCFAFNLSPWLIDYNF